MAIKDVLWRCPNCHRPNTLRPERPADRCHACNARFRRAGGARIRMIRPDGSTEEREAHAWLSDATPPPLPDADVWVGPERVRVRVAAAQRPLEDRGRVIGWIERFGKPLPGALRLTPEDLDFAGDDGRAIRWPLLDLTVIQPASRALQVHAPAALASITFLEGSVRYWEIMLKQALRDRYRRAGRGEIRHFQPRVQCVLPRSP